MKWPGSAQYWCPELKAFLRQSMSGAWEFSASQRRGWHRLPLHLCPKDARNLVRKPNA